MAKRVKKHYNYWELPQWENSKVEVVRLFKHEKNNNPMVTLKRGDSIYVIKVPKRIHWNMIKEGMTLYLTKISVQPKRAVIDIKAISV